MKVSATALPEVLLIEPQVFGDERGFFMETWRHERYAEHGLPAMFVQDNLSRSSGGIVRGLHLQYPQAQGKLVYVIDGEVLDVAVDVRLGSPTFGQWVGAALSGANKRQLYLPPGFAHGFCVTGEHALLAYKCTAPYRQKAELGIRWDDPTIGIEWPIRDPVLSPKDQGLPLLADIPPAALPPYQGLGGTPGEPSGSDG